MKWTMLSTAAVEAADQKAEVQRTKNIKSEEKSGSGLDTNQREQFHSF